MKPSFVYSFLFISVAIFLVRCAQKEPKSLVGNYESYERTIFEKGVSYVKNESRVIGSSLQLNEDSTFLYMSCANIIRGKWKVNADSLELFASSNRWRNDSLHEYGFEGRHPSVSSEPFRYLIESDRLLRKREIAVDGESRTSVDEMIKVEQP